MTVLFTSSLLSQLSDEIASLTAQSKASFVSVYTKGGGAGSGIIWGTDGTIVTNHHVVPRDQATVKVDVVTEMKHYGLHRHYTAGTSVVMFGGGMKKGFVYGETAPERPLVAIRNPVSVTDLHATIMTAMGISPRTEFEVEGRPFYVTQDGKGQPIRDLFA